MADLRRVDGLLRAINPVPDEREALRVVPRTDPLWQTIRTRLEEPGAGHVDDVAAVGAERSTRRPDTPQLHRVAVAAGIILMAIVMALGVRFVVGTPDPVGEPEPAPETTESTGGAQAPAEPGDDVELLVTFSGGDGTDGCRYDGPTRFLEGEYRARLINEAGEVVAVNLDRLATGYDYGDFLDRMGARDGDPPLTVPPRDQDPAAHEWLDGSFRTILNLGADAGDIRLAAGHHVLYCWNEGEDGDLDLWPAGAIEVTAQP